VAAAQGGTAYTPDGGVAISVGPRASVVARSMSSSRELWHADVLPDDQVVRAVAVHPDGHVVAVAGGDIVGSETGTLALLDPRSGLVVETRRVASRQVNRLAFSRTDASWSWATAPSSPWAEGV
jgi:WD40 repeat protein